MQIDGKHFEQYFGDAILKRGYLLFTRGVVEKQRTVSSHHFSFAVGDLQVEISKRGDLISRHSCSVHSEIPCEHVAATLFYLYRNSLDLSDPRWKGVSRGQRKKTSKDDKAGSKAKQEFELAVKKIHEIFTSVPDEKINSVAIKKIVAQVEKFRLSEKNKNYADLALVAGFSDLLKNRFTADEKPLYEMFERSLKALSVWFYKGLTQDDLKIWLAALKTSLRSNNTLASGSYSFLLPRYLIQAKKYGDVLELQILLQKRKRKLHHSKTIDPLLIANLQLKIIASQLTGEKFSVGPEESGAELAIAKSDLLFLQNRNVKAMNLLDSHLSKVFKDYNFQYVHYLDHLMEKARDLRDKELEEKYLTKRILASPFINQEQVDRFFEIVPVDKKEERLQELVGAIRKKSGPFAFDKLSLILLKADLLHDLVSELKHEHKRFNLVHYLAVKLEGDLTEQLLQLYVRHLAEALAEARYYQVQQTIVDTAKIFLVKLPSKKVETVIDAILDKIGHQAQISRYIRQVMISD